jgi:DNA-binding NtrC family response regulator
LASLLSARGHRVSVATPAAGRAAETAGGRVQAVLLDLASSDALPFLRRYAAQPQRAPIVCLADRRKPRASSDALRFGALDIVSWPLKVDELTASLANAQELVHRPDPGEAPAAWSDPSGDPAFGASAAMQGVLATVRRVAQSRSAVLIVGECGTGRETVARAVHEHGPSAGRPFITVVCEAAGLPQLAPIADGTAAGGTVYLKNVGDLPLPMQARVEELLRTRRRGGSSSEPRIIAGAQPRLFEGIERGAIRREFADAISVVRIDLPALRQRPQDVPLLAVHFLKQACREQGLPPKALSQHAVMLLAALPWRGNVTELRSFCERLAVLVPQGVVSLQDVIANLRFDGVEAIGPSTQTLREARERFEREYLTATLQHYRGRMGAAARQLGIERTNLYRKMKQLRIRRVGLLD